MRHPMKMIVDPKKTRLWTMSLFRFDIRFLFGIIVSFPLHGVWHCVSVDFVFVLLQKL